MMDVIKKDKQIKWIGLGLLFFGAFLVHVVFAAAYVGYETDMNCFSWWSSAVFEHGVNEFYHLEAFTDYPPGYMYILYVIGAIRSLFNMGGGLDTLSVVLLKMPAMLCDLGIGYVIYHVASKYTKHNYAM